MKNLLAPMMAAILPTSIWAAAGRVSPATAVMGNTLVHYGLLPVSDAGAENLLIEREPALAQMFEALPALPRFEGSDETAYASQLSGYVGGNIDAVRAAFDEAERGTAREIRRAVQADMDRLAELAAPGTELNPGQRDEMNAIILRLQDRSRTHQYYLEIYPVEPGAAKTGMLEKIAAAVADAKKARFRRWVLARTPEPGDTEPEKLFVDVDRRAGQLAALEAAAVPAYGRLFGLDEEAGAELFHDIMGLHPTAYGYHVPEHSHQPLLVLERVLDRLAAAKNSGKKVGLRQTVDSALFVDMDERIAALPEMHRVAPLKYFPGSSSPLANYRIFMDNNRETLANLRQALGLDGGEKVVDSANEAGVRATYNKLDTERQRLEAAVSGNHLLGNLLELDIDDKEKTIFFIAALLHDIDPGREEGTLARVAYTNEWLGSPEGERILRTLARPRLGELSDPAEFNRFRDKVRSYLRATDFQYDLAKKAAIWPAFLKQLAAAWDVGELSGEAGFTSAPPAGRLALSLGHLIRIADQYGAYTLAASVTPNDKAAAFAFMEEMVRGLKRELRRTPFVPPFLRTLDINLLLKGTYSFLTQREPGSPTADDKVAVGETTLDLLQVILDQVAEAAAYFQQRFK